MRNWSVLLLCWPLLALAAGEPPARLEFFNRTVFVFRAPLMGMSPADREQATQLRLKTIITETEGAQVELRPVDAGLSVALNGRLAFYVLPADVDPESGLTHTQTAEQAAAKLLEAVQQSQAQKNQGQLVSAMTTSAVGLLVLVLVLAVVGALRRRALKVLEGHADRGEWVSVRSLKLVRRRTLFAAAQWVMRLAALAVLVVGTVQWLALTLTQFPFTRPWGLQLASSLREVAVDLMLQVVVALPDLVIVAGIGWLTWAALRGTRFLFAQLDERHWLGTSFTTHMAIVTRKLISTLLVLLALVMAYPYLPGSHTEAFKGLSVLVGLMVSLGGSNTIGQAAAGLILIYSRAFALGDQLEVAGQRGTVVDIGLFATRLTTAQGEEVVIPNATLLSNSVRNYTRADALRLEVVLTIGYDVPRKQVEGLMLEGARRTGALLTEPAPRVRVTGLDDFYVRYRLDATAAATHQRDAVLNELHAHVLDAFNEAQVQIMSPHYVADPATPKLAPAA